jgi:hypothetical protein
VFYGEYECIGPGANNTSRVSFAKQLNESEAAPFMDVSYIDGNEWLLYTPLFNLHEDDYIHNDQIHILNSMCNILSRKHVIY